MQGLILSVPEKRVKFYRELSLHQGMEITNAPRPGNLLLTAARIENWTVGRLLTALVSRTNADGSYTLQAGRQQIRVRSESPLEPGTRLDLEVVETGARTILRRRIPTPPPAQETRTLREALPRQAPAAALLSNLHHISAGSETGSRVLPREITQLAQQIEQALASKEALQRPEVLKQALKDSGLFLEARLAAMTPGRPDPGLARDFKAGLLKLARLLGTHLSRTDRPADPASGARTPATGMQAAASGKGDMAPPPMRQAPPATPPPAAASLATIEDPKQALHELNRQVDATLARVRISQLNSVPGGDGISQFWLLELPLRAGDQVDSFQLRIRTEEEPASSRGGATSGWSVMLSFNLDGLGAMYARLAMAGDRLSTSLWAEQEHTVGLLEHYQGLLQRQLASAGLGDIEVAIRAGRPAGFDTPAQSPGLIHETV